MVDLNMPDGLNDEEWVRWLRETGEVLCHETGRPSGVSESQPGKDDQPVWVVWWSDWWSDDE